MRGWPASMTSDPAAGAGQDQGCGQSGGAAADHRYVVCVHAIERAASSRYRQRLLRNLGNLRRRWPHEHQRRSHRGSPRPGRPPAARPSATQRGLTLTAAAQTTGISKSTLSRLENGERRPSLELLLPLAQAYRVPLDDLVGAPEVGDPRIRLKPKRVNGRTVVPLTRHAGGMQAWKIVIPVTKNVPELRTHEGYEWLYVIAGKMRLDPRRARPHPRAGRGRRVRHQGTALVRQHRRRASRGAQPLRPPRRTDAPPRANRRPNPLIKLVSSGSTGASLRRKDYRADATLPYSSEWPLRERPSTSLRKTTPSPILFGPHTSRRRRHP